MSRIDPDHPAYDALIDGRGTILYLTWREYGELMSVLDNAAENEEAYGWSARRIRAMLMLLQSQAHPQAVDQDG
jgi:hypothetical protein